jgi:hypothetical protein
MGKKSNVPLPKPKPKPFTNPIKKAINKFPSKVEKKVKNFFKGPSYSIVPAIKQQVKKYKEEGPSSLLSPSGKAIVGAVKNMVKPTKKAEGGSVKKNLKAVPEGNKGLGKLPTEVRNKMGFMKRGGAVAGPKGYKKKTKPYQTLPDKNVKGYGRNKVEGAKKSKPYETAPDKINPKDYAPREKGSTIQDLVKSGKITLAKKNRGGLVKGGTASQMSGQHYKGTF